MVKSFLNRTMLISVSLMLVVCMGLCSCETLRKKFTRHKKAGDEVKDFQPVLEPQEYPAPENNPIENYKQHYALLKVWYTDLWTAINDKNADGMAKYSIKQILDHIDQMRPLLKTEKAKQLDELVSLLSYYQSALDQPRAMRNYSRVQSDLRAFDRTLRDKFRDDRLQGEFINQ